MIRSENGVCYPNLQPLQDHWLLGDIFIQEYCQVIIFFKLSQLKFIVA